MHEWSSKTHTCVFIVNRRSIHRTHNHFEGTGLRELNYSQVLKTKFICRIRLLVGSNWELTIVPPAVLLQWPVLSVHQLVNLMSEGCLLWIIGFQHAPYGAKVRIAQNITDFTNDKTADAFNKKITVRSKNTHLSVLTNRWIFEILTYGQISRLSV